jgi:hypothetical protein
LAAPESQKRFPPVWLLNFSRAFILRLVGLHPGFERHVTDEDILGVIIEQIGKASVLGVREAFCPFDRNIRSGGAFFKS